MKIIIALFFEMFSLKLCGSFISRSIGHHAPLGRASFHHRYYMSASSEAADNIDYSYHRPVLLNECCDYLAVTPGGVYVDCTLGGGGHTREILRRGGRVVGCDQDSEAVATASALLKEHIAEGRLEITQINFRQLESHLKQRSSLAPTGRVDGLLLDLGVSSHQINMPARGFAFSNDGPLDMRMSHSLSKVTAAEILNDYAGDAIADILYLYGDETRSRQIAREIVAARPLKTTSELALLINKITPWKHRTQTLARCFQALRIVVNDEMAALDDLLLSAHRVLRPGGRLVVISYHSLEDRKVKCLFKHGSVTTPDTAEDRTLVSRQALQSNPWRMLFKGAQLPTPEELELNTRSRSAKLRVAELVDLEVPQSTVGERASFMGSKQLMKKERRRQQQELEQEQELL